MNDDRSEYLEHVQETNDKRTILEEVLKRHGVEILEWNTSTLKCVCPAQGCERTDGIVFFRKWPWVHCFSEGCRPELHRINAEIRETLQQEYGNEGFGLDLAEAKRQRLLQKRGAYFKKCRRHARLTLLPRLQERPPVPLAAWLASSPLDVRQIPVEEHWRVFIDTLYAPRDIIWIGDLHETKCANIRRVEDWLKLDAPLGTHLSACTFREYRGFGPDKKGGIELPEIPGLYRPSNREVTWYWKFGERKREWVKQKRYLVFESDVLSAEVFGNVIQWLAQYMAAWGMYLVAVVHTGGKSIHCWFSLPTDLDAYRMGAPEQPGLTFKLLGKGFAIEDPPASEMEAYNRAYHAWWRSKEVREALARKRRFEQFLEELKAYARGLACDGGLWHPSGTARLPGQSRMSRDGLERVGYQRLLFLNPAKANKPT